jgi:hypothetical protein
MSDAGYRALAAVPELIAAAVLTIVSVRQAKPKHTSVIALAIGACIGSALTVIMERVVGD